VKEYYTWFELRIVASKPDTSFIDHYASISLRFEQLKVSEYDSLALKLCEIHTIILYTLHAQVIPEYIAYHTLGGDQTVHWESLSPDSETHSKRLLVLDRMNRMCANRRVESAQGLLLDYYGWRKDNDDVGILHLLYRDLPNTKGTQKRDSEDDDDDDDDIEAVHRAATRSGSTRSIASGYVGFSGVSEPYTHCAIVQTHSANAIKCNKQCQRVAAITKNTLHLHQCAYRESILCLAA
jgi:hypothetical protein